MVRGFIPPFLRNRAVVGAFCLGALFCAARGQSPNVLSPTHYHMLLGYVIAANGAALSGADLDLYDARGNPIESGRTGDSGQFEFWTTVASPYELRVSWNHQFATVSTSGSGTVRVPIQPATATRPAPHGNVSANDLAAGRRARICLTAALKALARHDFANALSQANAALTIDSQWGRAWYVRGLIGYEQKQPVQAESDLDTAIRFDPGYAPSYVALATLQIDAGRTDAARATLAHALALPPVMWQANAAMATLELAGGEYESAERLALDAASDPAANPEVHFVAAEAAYHQHDSARALEQYRAFLAAHPVATREADTARQRIAELTAPPGG